MNTVCECPQCGKPLPSDSPKRLCPACLLAAALPGQSAGDSAATGLHDPSSAEAIAPEAGMRLKYFGDYELLDEIARGGMGVVWKARQASLKRDVALKMIRAGALAGAAEVERFLREAEAAANLQHPNIVAIHEVGEHGGQHYFSMDYVAGRDLAVLVHQDGPLPAQRAARYVKIIAEAIHFAHQRGTLHRDLKPQNVLIDAADQPRITDFGLAKFLQDDSALTQPGVVMGTPSYMPPEQAAGRHGDIGPASDVYSLGAMLYELLTGRPPFRGATPLATLREVMENEPASPRRLVAAIPPELETICLKCLEKSPSARYPTARALAEELDRFLKGEPILAQPASPVRKVMSWVRRHPGTLVAAAAFVMVTLAIGLFYVFEENAFLRAKQADPALERRAGSIHEFSQVWNTISIFVLVAGLYSFFFATARARGLSFKELFDPALYARHAQPLTDRARTFVIAVAMILTTVGVVQLVTTIQAHVWEGASIFDQLWQIYGLIYFGFMMFSMVVRDYQLAHYGPASRQLSAEQIESIGRAMEDWDAAKAIKLYRDAVPDANLWEANQYVTSLAESLRQQHPGKFVPPPLSLAGLNWNLMLITIAIEAVLLGVLWYVLPPANPAATVMGVAVGFLLGAGMMAGTRVKGYWKRTLLLAPAVATWSLQAIVVRPADELPGGISTWLYVCGIACGVFLMMSGFTRRRGRSL